MASDNRDPAAEVPPNVDDRNKYTHVNVYLATLLDRRAEPIVDTAANCLVSVLRFEWMNPGGG